MRCFAMWMSGRRAEQALGIATAKALREKRA